MKGLRLASFWGLVLEWVFLEQSGFALGLARRVEDFINKMEGLCFAGFWDASLLP